MNNNIEMEQSWWHIEDHKSPVESRSIREVIDIYTKTKDLELDLENIKDIYEIRVKGRNRSVELAFINSSSSNNKNELHINLGNLKDWPIIMGYSGFEFNAPRHVRLEISYKQNSNFDTIIMFKVKNYKLKRRINSYIHEYLKLIDVKKDKEAFKQLVKAIKLDPIYATQKLESLEISNNFNKGIQFHKNGNMAEYIGYYKEINNINPKYLFNRLFLYYNLDKYKNLSPFVINIDYILCDLEFSPKWKMVYKFICNLINITLNYLDKSYIKKKIAKIKEFRLFQGYVGSYEINWPIQPEFSITVPLGMEMNSNGNSLRLYFENDNIYQELNFEHPSISKKDGKQVYTYIITSKSYDIIKKTPNDSNVVFKAIYEVNNELKFFTIPIFSLVLYAYSLIEIKTICEIFLKQNFNQLISLYNPSFVIIALSFLGLYLTIRKDDYEIPFKYFVIGSIILSIIAIIALLYSYQVSLSINTTVNNTMNNIS